MDVHISPMRDIPDLLLSYRSLPSLSMIIASTSMLLDKILAHYFLWLRHIVVGIWNGFLFHHRPWNFWVLRFLLNVSHAAANVACVVPESQLSPRRGLEWKGPVMRHLNFQLFKQSLYCPLSWLLTTTQSPRSVVALSVLHALSHRDSLYPEVPCLFLYIFSFNFLLYCGEEPISINARVEKLA